MMRCCAAALALLLASCAHDAHAAPRKPLRIKTDVSIVPAPRMLAEYDETYEWRGGLHARGILDAALRKRHGPEAYTISVDQSGVRIRYGGRAGWFYGLQTLEQLQRDPRSGRGIPYVRIVDWPAYRWRGIHLDASRHFFPVPAVKHLIDAAAHYKLNIFHWHLTDDQAWRLRIRAYPALAAPQAYSAADVGDVVAFARSRHVTVVPEIEMVSHNAAALRAYAASAQTAAFYTRVLGEVVAEFPGMYVHAGGDEVSYTPGRRAMLQSLVKFLRSRNRRPVVWDDARDAGLGSAVAYMVWHPSAALTETLALRNNIVVSSDGPLYFDAYQGDRAQEPRAGAHMSTLEQVYDYDPPQGAHVLGVQANIWTEHIASESHLMYMAFPRVLALAELAWDPPANKNWNSFLARLPAQFAWLDSQDIRYRIPSVAFVIPGARFFPRPGNAAAAAARTNAASAAISLTVPLAGARIFYTTDGTVPTARSHEYRGAFTVTLERPVLVRAVAMSGAGRTGTVSECTLARARVSPDAGARAWASIISP